MCGIAGEFAFGREQVTAVASRMIAMLILKFKTVDPLQPRPSHRVAAARA